jgi:hypothetical protein
MRITLENDGWSWFTTYRGENHEFCEHIFSQLGATGNKTILTVRLKNPRKSGFTKVALKKDHGMWRWYIEGMENEQNVFFLDVTDKFFTKLFHPEQTGVIWIKFTPPKA